MTRIAQNVNMLNRISNYFRTLQNPDIYHGHATRPPFFEGWYFKLVSADESQRIAVIPGVFLGEGGHAFVQVLDGVRGSADYIRFPLESFWAAQTEFEVRIGPNHFTRQEIQLDIELEQGRLQGALRFQGLTPWPVSWRAPGIMGWYAYVPFMECYHGVVSLDHTIEGALRFEGQEIDYSGGRGYIEKDWGQSFPSAYVWMQSNHFEQVGTSLSASIAMIPWLGRAFRGFIVGLWHHGRLYRFATYTGAETTHLTIDDQHVHWRMQDRDYELELRALRESGGLIFGPTRQDMLRRVEETILASIEVRLSQRNGERVFHGLGRNAGLEVNGDLERLLENP
jgi:hypothetical protein